MPSRNRIKKSKLEFHLNKAMEYETECLEDVIKWRGNLEPNLITTPFTPASLIKVFDPAPKICNLRGEELFLLYGIVCKFLAESYV